MLNVSGLIAAFEVDRYVEYKDGIPVLAPKPNVDYIPSI